jgi:hypothetical protein
MTDSRYKGENREYQTHHVQGELVAICGQRNPQFPDIRCTYEPWHKGPWHHQVGYMGCLSAPRLVECGARL